MRITRRLLGTGILGLAAGLGLGLGTRALAERPTGVLLAEELNRRLGANPLHARFDVSDFRVRTESGIRIAADIRLDWTPGFRTRRIEGAGANESAAWAALLGSAVTEFAAAFPGDAAAHAAA